MESKDLTEARKIINDQYQERLKTLPVVPEDIIKKMEESWGNVFKLYIYFNDIGELKGRKYKGAFARAMQYDLAVGRCLAQRPHAIYNFSAEYKELDSKFSSMIMDHFDNLSEEEKDSIVSF